MTEALAPSSWLFQTPFAYFTSNGQTFGAKVKTELSLAPQASGLVSRLDSCHLSVVIQRLHIEWEFLHRSFKANPNEVGAGE